ncbi:MAG: glycosyltransferase family 39 protein [Candidatus Omnitrophota bacterium]
MGKLKFHKKMKRLLPDILLIIVIFIGAFIIRFYNIKMLPVNHDEANWARILLIWPELIKEIIGIPIIFFIPYSLRFFLISRISSPEVFTLNNFMIHCRFEPIIIGAGTVVLLYILAKCMYGRKTALISSLLLCFLPWHLIHSRIMGRVIWVPFFGCLIFLSLFKAFKAIENKEKIGIGLWFILSCFFMQKSLVSYESAALFAPIFFISLIWAKKDARYLLNSKITVILLLIAGLFSLPFIYKSMIRGDEFGQSFYRAYQENIFKGNLFANIWVNIKNNTLFTFKELFFNFKSSSLLYGKALKAPLLAHPIAFFLLFTSCITSFFQRKTADKILLTWLILGLIGVLGGVNFFQPRYALIILPPIIILIAKFIAQIFNYGLQKQGFTKAFILIITGTFCFSLIITEAVQWTKFCYAAPLDLGQCRHNSYGCQEAGEYLSQLDNIKDYVIIQDSRMTTDFYLNYYLWEKGKIDKYYDFRLVQGEKEQKKRIYVLWAPESHSQDYWGDLFIYKYVSFKKEYSHKVPIKTIYYPNGLEAIQIFIIE